MGIKTKTPLNSQLEMRGSPFTNSWEAEKTNRFLEEDSSDLDTLSLRFLQFIQITVSTKWLGNGVQERGLE